MKQRKQNKKRIDWFVNKSLIFSLVFLFTSTAGFGANRNEFCPDIRAVFQEISRKLEGDDLHQAYINNAKAIVKNKDLRVTVQLECKKMSKGIETIAKKEPAMGSDAWKQAVLNILTH